VAVIPAEPPRATAGTGSTRADWVPALPRSAGMTNGGELRGWAPIPAFADLSEISKLRTSS